MTETLMTVTAQEIVVGDSLYFRSNDSAYTVTRIESKGDFGLLFYTAPHGHLWREALTFERLEILRAV